MEALRRLLDAAPFNDVPHSSAERVAAKATLLGERFHGLKFVLLGKGWSCVALTHSSKHKGWRTTQNSKRDTYEVRHA